MGSPAAKARAAAHTAAAAAASVHAPAFTSGAVNRTVKGGAPTGSWTPATALEPSAAEKGKRAPAGAVASPTATPLASTQGSTGARTLNAAAAPAAVPTGGYTGSGAAGSGMGLQSFYGTEAFGLGASATATVNLANGNVNLHSADQAYNAPGLSVHLDSFINNQVYGQGALGYGGVLSTGQDVGLSISGTTAGSTATFYGPSGFTGVFTAVGSGASQTWTMPPGINADLVHNSDGTWTLTYHASGEKLSFTAGGYLVKDTDRNNVGLSFSYNSSNRLTSITDAVGRVTTLAYNAGGRLASVTDPTGRVSAYTYNSGGQLNRITYADASTMNISYDAAYMIAWVQNRNGNWTHFGYDPSTRVTSIERYLTPGARTGDAAVTAFAYNTTNGASSSTQETSPTDGVTTYALDSLGRVTSVTDPLGRMRSQTWTPNSDMATSTDAMGSAGTGGGAATAGNVTTYGYDTLNNRTAVQTPTGASTRAAYTATSGSTGTAYQPQTATDASGHTQAFTYDTAGNMLSVRDTTATNGGGTGATATAFTYQAATPLATTSPTQCGGVAGQVCTATDGNGNVTTYRYDASGNLTKVTPAAPLGATTYTYDTAGRVTSVTDGKGQKTSYVYDAADRITTTTFNNGETVNNEYDADGNLTVSTDSVGGSSYHDYDALDRPVWFQEPNFGGNGFGTEYDKAGNITGVDGIRGGVTYTYDAANELTAMTEPSGSGTETITFAYDRNGAETSRTFPGGLVQTTTRDNSGRATRIKAAAGATVASDLGYSYTAAGGSGTTGDRDLVQSRTDYAGTTAPAGSVTAYGHDGLNRLTSARETTPTGALNAAWTYTYDNAGNRTGTTTTGATTVGATANTPAATTTWGYNGANEAVSRNGSTTGWSYDANGNQSAGTWGTGTYDDRDALTSATPTGTTTATSFSYLGTGNSTRESAGADTTLNGPLGLAGLVNGDVYTAFRHTPDGRVISVGEPDGTNQYYLNDSLGNVTTMISDSAVTATYSYDPYGVLRAINGVGAADNPFRYGQGFTDYTTGLIKLGARYYDPTQSRFTQVDPSGQEANDYLYAQGEPVQNVDPTGLQSYDDAVEIATAKALAAATLGFGKEIMAGKIKDPAFDRADGWRKMEVVIKTNYGPMTFHWFTNVYGRYGAQVVQFKRKTGPGFSAGGRF